VFSFGSTVSNETFRETVIPTVSGSTERLRFDDALGINPLDISDATIAVEQAANSPIPTAPPVPLIFSNTGTSATTVPEGGLVYTAPIDFPVQIGQRLLVSFTLTNSITIPVMHTDATNGDQIWTTAPGSGDHTKDITNTAFTGAGSVFLKATSVVTGLDVATNGTPTTAVVDDGVIEQAGITTPNADTNLVGDLMKDIATTPTPAGVINEGMESNQIIKDYPESGGGGPAVLSRLDRDLLDQPGLTTVIVDEGLEDLLFGADADDLADAFSTLVDDLHSAGIAVVFYGATPCDGYHGAVTHSDPCTAAVDQQRTLINGFLAAPVDGVGPSTRCPCRSSTPTRPSQSWIRPTA
jgi:hypothetical protein